MTLRARLLFAGLGAAIVLSAIVSGTSANRLSVTSARYTVTWNSLSFTAAGNTINCPVTADGSFHSTTISKVANALIGYITRATQGSCSGSGTVSVKQESLPWHVTYGGFTGTLPNITGKKHFWDGWTFSITIGSLICISHGDATHKLPGIMKVNGARTITGFQVDETAEIPVRGEFLCSFAGEGHVAGTGSVAVTGGTTAIQLTLI